MFFTRTERMRRGRAVFRKRISRAKLLDFFAAQPRCRWRWRHVAERITGRVSSAKLGHEVRLIPPAYVRPFVKRQKNDAADAEAICEAAQRPSMRFVPVKSEAAAGERRWCFGPVICWCGSERSSSMRCAVT